MSATVTPPPANSPPTDSLPEYESFFEYVRHLTTLSTGAILLQLALFVKVFHHPKWKAAAIVSLASFTLSVIASVVTYTLVLTMAKHKRTISDDPRRASAKAMACFAQIARYALGVTLVGFLLGVTAAAVFALGNLLAL